MELSQACVAGLVAQIYEAAEDPLRLQPFLERLCSVTGAVASGYFVQDIPNRFGHLVTQTGGSAESVRRYHEHYSRVNPWFQVAGSFSTGDVVIGRVEETLVGTEYYEEFWRPQGYHDTLTAYAFKDAFGAVGVMVARRKWDPDYGATEVGLFQALVPHLARVVDLQRRFFVVRDRGEALLHVLDHLPFGTIVVDDTGRVIVLNRQAQAVLDARNVLVLQGGALAVHDPSLAPEFRRLLTECIQTSTGKGTGLGGVLKIPRVDNHRGLSVLVTPVPRGCYPLTGPRPAAAVFLADRSTRPRLAVDILCELFGLTVAEGRIAAALAQGQRLQDVRRAFRIEDSTARTHLKHVFDKTGTRRQPALASLLHNSVAVLRAQ